MSKSSTPFFFHVYKNGVIISRRGRVKLPRNNTIFIPFEYHEGEYFFLSQFRVNMSAGSTKTQPMFRGVAPIVEVRIHSRISVADNAAMKSSEFFRKMEEFFGDDATFAISLISSPDEEEHSSLATFKIRAKYEDIGVGDGVLSL